MVWCGVEWCGVVRCGVPKALLPNGNGRDVLYRKKERPEGCVSSCVPCLLCGAPVVVQCRVGAVRGCPGDALPLCLMVLRKFSLGPSLCVFRSSPCCVEVGFWAAEILQYIATVRRAVGGSGSGPPQVLRPTALGRWAVVPRKSSTVHYPHAVRYCAVGVPLPTPLRQ